LSLVVSGIQAHLTIPEWRYRPELDPASLRRLLVFGGYVSIGTLTGFLFAHANRVLVGRNLGIAAVTYYSVPWNVSARVSQIVYALAEVIAPLTSALAAQKDIGTLRGLYTRSSRIMAVVAASAAVPLFVGATDLLSLWLGPTFADRSGATLRVLAFSAMAQSLSAVPYMVLNGMGKPAVAMLPTLGGVSVNVLLASTLSSRLGLPGMALAVATGLALQAALLMISVDRSLDVRPGSTRRLARLGTSAAISLTVGWTVTALMPSPWMGLIVGSLVSLTLLHGLLLATGWYDKREVDFLLQAFNSRKSPGSTPPLEETVLQPTGTVPKTDEVPFSAGSSKDAF
jgi:O-antigen/teichoic acid export membrane protein